MYHFVKLTRENLDTLVSWADQEGWNPGPHDADVFWHTDPDGFYDFFSNTRPRRTRVLCPLSRPG